MNPSTLEASKIPTSESSEEISPNNSCVVSMSQFSRFFICILQDRNSSNTSISNTCMHITFVQLLQHIYTYIYTAKLSSGKTFAVVHKIHYSLENFHGASGRGLHVLYTASDSRGNLSRSTEKPQKCSNSKVLPYTVYI